MSNHRMFEMSRLAASLLESIEAGDEAQTVAVLAAVEEPEIGAFLTALAGIVPHALRTRPDAGMSQFLAAYRASVDLAEQQAAGLECGES